MADRPETVTPKLNGGSIKMEKSIFILAIFFVPLLASADDTIYLAPMNIDVPYKRGAGRFTDGGPRCESGCESSNKPSKKEESAKELEQERALEAQKKLQDYLKAAYDLWKISASACASARTVEKMTMKYFIDSVSTGAFYSTYTLYLILRSEGLGGGKDTFDKLPQNVSPFADELKRIRDKEARGESEMVPPDSLPDDQKPPDFDPSRLHDEESLRNNIFRKPATTKEEGKSKVQEFLQRHEVSPYGELLSIMLDVFDKGKIAKNGLSRACSEPCQ